LPDEKVGSPTGGLWYEEVHWAELVWKLAEGTRGFLEILIPTTLAFQNNGTKSQVLCGSKVEFGGKGEGSEVGGRHNNGSTKMSMS
jgi:hypothetical protein